MKVEKIIWQKDGSEMVLIPGGSFEMGDHFNEGSDDELPVHTVELDAFYMDTYQVTVGRFKQFVEDLRCGYDGWDKVAKYSPGDNHPMIYVDWHSAVAYIKWAGKRLPTEAEWEYAARGGLVGKRYPWGDDDPTANKANYDGQVGRTSVVGSYAANDYGLYDMAGNVWEWCADWYNEDYYENSPAKNPPGPGTGKYRVLRGGSWSQRSDYLRVDFRAPNSPNNRHFHYGFRCVADVK